MYPGVESACEATPTVVEQSSYTRENWSSVEGLYGTMDETTTHPSGTFTNPSRGPAGSARVTSSQVYPWASTELNRTSASAMSLSAKAKVGPGALVRALNWPASVSKVPWANALVVISVNAVQ